MKNSTKILELW